ncbi:MAG: cobalt ABC transporter permease [Thermodesulfovibrionales bacterium]
MKSLISGLLLLCISITLIFCLTAPAYAEGGSKWAGVDESVVEKFAKEHGREAREPLINTDQGDLLLFVFLIAGTVGGFVAGYYWRTLTEERAKGKEQKTQTKGV